MPWMLRCFICMLEMLSCSMAPEFFRCFMTRAVSCVVASVAVLSSVNLCLRLFMVLSSSVLVGEICVSSYGWC